MSKKPQVSNKVRAQVALTALKNESTLKEIAQRYKVHPIQVGRWRKKLIDDAYTVFEEGGTVGAIEYERDMQMLYEQIGRLKVENDFLKKKITTIE